MSRCLKCVHFLKGGVNGTSRPPSEAVRTDDIGLCRRNPPIWLPAEMGDEGNFAFPAIHQDHRCGEWEGLLPC